MGPKTASNVGAAFQKKIDALFALEGAEVAGAEEAPAEKEEENTGDKTSEDE